MCRAPAGTMANSSMYVAAMYVAAMAQKRLPGLPAHPAAAGITSSAQPAIYTRWHTWCCAACAEGSTQLHSRFALHPGLKPYAAASHEPHALLH